MKGKRAGPTAAPGPLRWSYREYLVVERATPAGRRFEVRSPNDEIVLFCRVKRSEPRLVFHADEKEATELFRLEPRRMRNFHRSYEAIDAVSGQAFGIVRKRVYEPTKKTEWFVFSPEGEQVGMLTETAPEPSLLRRIIPMDRFHARAWALHWGQSIAGTLEPKTGLVGERLEVNLKFDAKDEIDRRLVLAVAIAMRADPHHSDKAGA